MVTYTKLFSDILASSIWNEPDSVRIVWITMLALSDRDGIVGASVPGLAHLARQPLEATAAALEVLSAPDPYSRTKDHDGRRISAIDGGWQILNYERHRERASIEEKRAKDAARQARKRERDRAKDASRKVTRGPARSPKIAQAEADAEAKADASAGSSGPPTPAGPDVAMPSVPLGGRQDDQAAASGPEGPSGTAGPRGTDDETERIVLFKWLWSSAYRRNSQNRHHDVTDTVFRLHAADIGVEDLTKLAKKASFRGKNPAGLFAHWIDNLDEAMKELGKR
jgi:hypothetical protein